jgi:hypothetical protein
MTKQLRTIIVIVVVIAMLAGAMLFLNKSDLFNKKTASSSPASAHTISVIKTDANDISLIAVTSKTGNYSISKTSTSTWTVDGLKDVPIKASSVSETVTYLSTLIASMLVEKNPSDLAKYGLSNPLATFDVTISNKVRSIVVGNKTPLGDGYYTLDKDTNTVYNTSTSIDSYFLTGLLYYVDKSILTFNAQTDAPNIEKLYFGGAMNTQPITIAKVKSTSSISSTTTSSSPTVTEELKITSPLSLGTNTEAMSNLATTLSTLSADSCVSVDTTEANLKKYGLDKPQYIFEITIKGVTTKLSFGNTENINSSDIIYFMVAGKNAIYDITASTVAFCKFGLKDLAMNIQLLPFIDDVKSITVESAGKSWNFNLSGTSDTLVISYGTNKINTDYFRNYYQKLVGLQFEEQATEPKNAQVLYKITYNYKDATKKSDVEEFLDLSATECFWKINGQGLFAILKNNLDNLINNTNKIVSGQDVSTN